jgi:small subunit ribosomal protein S20
VLSVLLEAAASTPHDDRKHDRSPLMANTKSAKRATRVAKRRTEVNKSRRTQMKTNVRGVEEALASGDAAAAATALKAAEPILMRAAQKGIVHKKTASRKVSRLAARVKAMSA